MKKDAGMHPDSPTAAGGTEQPLRRNDPLRRSVAPPRPDVPIRSEHPSNGRPGDPAGTEAARLRDTVGAMLADQRGQAGLSQSQLATRARIGAATIAKIEQGRQRPSWSTLQRLAAALNPDDPVRARAVADDLAVAAGPSLAGSPRLPTTLAREQLVAVLAATLRALGHDVNDDEVRHVVVEQIRALFAGTEVTLNGGRP